MLLDASPCFGIEYEQDGQYFKTANEHIHNKHDFGENAKVCKVAHGANSTEAGANVVEASAKGTKSMMSPARPTQDHTFVGFTATSPMLQHKDTTSKIVSHNVPSQSARLIGLFPQYAKLLFPITPCPVETRMSPLINLPKVGL